jgi:hypothetical protein
MRPGEIVRIEEKYRMSDFILLLTPCSRTLLESKTVLR